MKWSLCFEYPSLSEKQKPFRQEDDTEISKKAIPRIIKFAFNNSIIKDESEKSFIDFLQQNINKDFDKPLPDNLTFSDVIYALSTNYSVNVLIQQLEKITKEFALPQMQSSMITRLKKDFLLNTPKKRTLLRLLAYKLAEKRPDLNWHYEMLVKLPHNQ